MQVGISCTYKQIKHITILRQQQSLYPDYCGEESGWPTDEDFDASITTGACSKQL